jgi:IS30 family transposase
VKKIIYIPEKNLLEAVMVAHTTYRERITIKSPAAEGLSIRKIHERTGRARATISKILLRPAAKKVFFFPLRYIILKLLMK